MRKVSTESTIEVCDAHKDEAKVKAYIRSDANRGAIREKLADHGMPEPDWINLRVEFVPVERERVVVPIGCDREGCKSEARWQIVQRVPEIGRKKARVEITTNLCVCDHHRMTAKADDLRGPDERKATFEFLQAKGVLMPDLDRMTIGFIPIQGARRAPVEVTGGDT